MKNIVIVNSEKKISSSFFDLFLELSGEQAFCFWLAGGSHPGKIENLAIKNKYFGPSLGNPVGSAVFLAILPFFWLKYFVELFLQKKREGLSLIICTSARERLIFTPLGKLLKIRVFWLEMPGLKNGSGKFFLSRLFRQVKILVFTAADKQRLIEKGFIKERLIQLSLGINLQSIERQENIFYGLAKADKPGSSYKSFTVGVLYEDGDRRRLEILLQAAKNCVNLIPNFRLVVIGTGPDNSHWNWLIKSLGLERRVWLVGNQNNLLQWFNDLDLYLVLADNPSLVELERALMAASQGLPLLGFSSENLVEIINHGQNGLLCEDKSAEALAQKIISIEADDRARRLLGENSKKMVCQQFDRRKQLERLQQAIN